MRGRSSWFAPAVIAWMALLLVASVDADCFHDCLVGCADVPPRLVNQCIKDCRNQCRPPAAAAAGDEATALNSDGKASDFAKIKGN